MTFETMDAGPHIFVIDNYDSFTYNLIHLLQQLPVTFVVKRNDAFSLDEVAAYSHVLISPGPGLPAGAGNTMKVIETYRTQKSILGVCLGMQALMQHAGAQITNMATVQHGAHDLISCEPRSQLFEGVPRQFRAGRYHSWAFLPANVPDEYRVTAQSEDGFVMAVEHVSQSLMGVQFHPESIMTEHGLEMLHNWVRRREV